MSCRRMNVEHIVNFWRRGARKLDINSYDDGEKMKIIFDIVLFADYISSSHFDVSWLFCWFLLFLKYTCAYIYLQRNFSNIYIKKFFYIVRRNRNNINIRFLLCECNHICSNWSICKMRDYIRLSTSLRASYVIRNINILALWVMQKLD